MAILCTNALVVALNRRKSILKGQQILIDQGVIVEVGKRVMASGFHIEERLDCSGKIVMPGLVNTHSHLTEILQRSLRDNVRMEIWRRYRAFTEEMVNPSAEEKGTRGGRLTRVREEKVIRKVEPISKRMRRLYGMIARNRPDSAESVIRKLYRRAFKEEKRPRFILH